MDENKDLLSAEAENTNDGANSALEADTGKAGEESTFASELAELGDEDFAQEYAESTKAKKKFPLQASIIIAGVLVACVILTFLVFKCFFDTSIVGAWTMKVDEATADQASETTTEPSSGEEDEEKEDYLSYYVFDSDGSCNFCIGSITYKGTYKIETDDKGNRTVNMSILGVNLSATFNYKVSGNIFTGRTLELTYGDSDDIKPYILESAKVVTPEIKPDKDFKGDDKIVGEWNYYNGYDNMYTFNSDGTVNVNQGDVIIIDGTYTVKDNKIIVKFYAEDERTTELMYSVDGDMLTINGVPHYRVGSASADEAKNNANSSILMQ